MRILPALCLALSLVAPLAHADGDDDEAAAPRADRRAEVAAAVEGHVLPRMAAFSQATRSLADAARRTCAGERPRAALEAAYQGAFDAWMGVFHLDFGPLEAEGRAPAIEFWPDQRGLTPRTLQRLIAEQDAAADDPVAYAEVSIAARGLMALDWLLYDPSAPALEGYACRLAAVVAADLANTAASVEADWRGGYAEAMTAPDPDEPGALYRDSAEALATFHRAFATALESLSDLRLGRPLGDGAQVKPRRAEAWRSGRPLRNVRLALAALDDLAERAFVPALTAADARTLRMRLDAAIGAADAAPAPMVQTLGDEAGRAAIVHLRQEIDLLRTYTDLTLASKLGVGLGFNALDGD